VHFYIHLCTPEKTSWSITHPEIAPGQARLTLEFFIVGLLKKNIYLDVMSILSILLSLEPDVTVFFIIYNRLLQFIILMSHLLDTIFNLLLNYLLLFS
jgi:hypothetical protein